jgi:Zn-dependent protease with chaperone function
MVSSRALRVHPKEKRYLMIMMAISLLAYTGLFYGFVKYPVLGVWVIYFALFYLLSSLYFMGYLRGNAIRLQQNQCADIYDILRAQSEKLGLKEVPTLYLLQGNGILNAFATRFASKNVVILHSDVLEAAYKEGIDAVTFIMGHELGHIVRNHVGFVKSYALLPAKFIPFLGFAYSRACEYTCDMIGYDLCPEGAEKGILLLAAGKDLYKKINVTEALSDASKEKGFSTWFAEIFSTHPHLINRVALLHSLYKNDEVLKFKTSTVAANEGYAPKTKESDISPS